MIENEEVIKYFNARSENWNDEIVINDKKINKILERTYFRKYENFGCCLRNRSPYSVLS